MNEEIKNFRLIAHPDENSIEEVELFNQHLEKVINESKLPIVVDFDNIEMVFSSGLGILIDAYKKCNKEKILFAVVNINSAVQKIIETTRLNTILNVYNTAMT